MLDDKVKANIRQQFNQCSKSDENSVRKLYERIDRKYYNSSEWDLEDGKGLTKNEWLEQIAFLDSLFPYSSTGRYPMRYRDAEDKGDASKILLPKEREERTKMDDVPSTPFEIAMARIKERSVDPKQTMDDALEQIRMRAEKGEGNE